MTAIHIKGLQVDDGQKTLLQALDFTIHPGTALTLIGWLLWRLWWLLWWCSWCWRLSRWWWWWSARSSEEWITISIK